MMREILMTVSMSLIPLLIGTILIHGLYKKVPVYETFVAGAKQGFEVGVRILPYLVAMMVAVSPDLIPLAFMRSLSGSGTLGIFSEIAAVHGPGSPVTKTAAVMTGSSETTFYVLAV